MVQVIIRGVKFMDINGMMQVNCKNLPENYDISYWKQIFTMDEGKQHSFVAEYCNELIGYIFANKNTIISFAINEPFRHFGIGKELLTHCLNTYSSDVILHVRISNKIALNLYKKYDFTIDLLEGKYYGDEDGYQMIHKYNKKKYPEKKRLNIIYTKSQSDKVQNDIQNDSVEFIESRNDITEDQLHTILNSL